jgi:glycosyltransferase involved in cell wall biosynthesis
MRIAVLNVQVPFLRGGAEFQADWLVQRLREHGHRAEVVRLPFYGSSPRQLIEQMLAARMLRLPGFDRVIGLKFPAYLIPHEDKVLWVLHQYRQVYDLWGTEYQPLPDTVESRFLRQVIRRGDDALFRAVRRLFVTSHVNARRMQRFNGITPQVLHPPLGSEDGFTCEPAEDFVFFPSRLSANKRQALAAEAMHHVSSGTRLVIAGPPDHPDELERLHRVLADGEAASRVELRATWIPEEEKRSLLARCLGVLFCPYDEDFGYVTMESQLSHKPVITCTDSGGPVDLVCDGESGWVVEPEPRAIAAAIDRLAADRRRAAQMGEAGAKNLDKLEINWDRAVEALTA